ncbi:MAG TPA: class I SAM-dependent methyltransferase [Candidatus Binatia bacterium]
MTEARLSYDEIAGAYDRARPSYPDALVDDILTFAQMPQAGRVLEIGCGTGQATRSFAARGLRLVCLEPAPAVAQIARQRLQSFHLVEVIGETFEGWPVERDAFDLIFSATAFHWVRRDVRFLKAAQALRVGGTLAIFNAVPSPQTSLLPDGVKNVMKRVPLSNNSPQWPFERQFSECSAFERVEKCDYMTKRFYDAQGLEDLLRTLNRFRTLPTQEQAAVLNTARAAAESQGGSLSLDFQIRLIMAHRERRRAWWQRVPLWLLHRSE